MHFWQVATLFLGGVFAPVKYGFSGAMPLFIKSRLLSFCGTREKLGSLRCPLLSKNFKNLSRISLRPNCSMLLTSFCSGAGFRAPGIDCCLMGRGDIQKSPPLTFVRDGETPRYHPNCLIWPLITCNGYIRQHLLTGSTLKLRDCFIRPIPETFQPRVPFLWKRYRTTPSLHSFSLMLILNKIIYKLPHLVK